MNTGDFILIDYIGKVKDSGEIFDLTKEDKAKELGVYNQNLKYKPVPVILDSDFILKGLSDELKLMKIGEKKIIEIKPENAFGERNANMVQQIPLAKFKEQDLEPKVGFFINISGMKGRVVSVSGGRVTVDFNHPLAGKTLEYEIEILGEIKDTKDKIEAIIFFLTSVEKEDLSIILGEKDVEIELKKKEHNLPREAKEIIAKTIKQWVKPIEKVKFIDVFQ